MSKLPPPLWLLAELTYRCPLQCSYCSNPIDYPDIGAELSTEDWIRVLHEGRELGATQLGFSGGEPLVRKDLEVLVKEARKLGYYTNLITSAVGMTGDRVQALKDAGLDHIQISFQATDPDLNNYLAGTDSFFRKQDIATAVKDAGLPMVLCFVTHKKNIHQVAQMLDLACDLRADYVELATTQYYGWALYNRSALMPSKAQLQEAEAAVQAFRQTPKGADMKVYYVIPDYYEERPKPCMSGWGQIFMSVAPDGVVMPCHAARQLPISLPNVHEHSLGEIWRESTAFNAFRGDEWMQEPCRSCDEKHKDFGGCRCQAFQFLGDAAATDPVCAKSPQRHVVDAAIDAAANTVASAPLIFRNPREARALMNKP